MWNWLLAFGLLWVGTLAEDGSLSCPDHCRCFSDQDNYRAAKCTAAALNTHYTDIFPSIKVLNLKPVHKALSVKLAPKMFQRFRNVKILNLSNCSIPQLPNDVFFGLRYASDIDLSYNRIRSINGIVFKNLPALQTLLLRGNPLILNPFTTIISDTLRELDVGECGLKTVPVHTFSNVNRLTHLSLDGNQLQTIYYQSIPNNLRYLNLAGNKITNVPTKVLLSLSFLRRIDLSENPVNCTCSLMLMQDWFSGRGVALENDVICNSPTPYHGKNLNKINENELCKYELHQERQMNNLKFSSYKHRDTDHMETEFNALPTYDVLMADQPKSDDAEQLYSDDRTRSLGTHMELGKETASESMEEGSGSDGEITRESSEDKHSAIDPVEESGRNWSFESSSETTASSVSESTETTGQNVTSIEEENDSKNHSSEFDFPEEETSAATDSSYGVTSENEKEHLTTTEDYESSGEEPLTQETSSKVELMDETESFPSTTESISSSSTEETVISSSTERSTEASTDHPWIDISGTHTDSVEVSTSEGPPQVSTTWQDIHTIPPVISTEASEPFFDTTKSSTPEITTPAPVEVSEPIIIPGKVVTDGLERYSELSTEASISNDTEDVVAKADTAGVAQSVTTYIIIAVIALPVIILILMAACRKRSPRKVRLPQDTESNLGTELQDMDTLLPKNGTENGVKVVPKANGAANPADSKSPEEVAPVLQSEPEPEPELPIEEPPPSRQNGGTAPIQKTKAKLTVLADSIPKTPVFIHKPYPD